MHALIIWLNQLNLEVSNCSSETLIEEYSIESELTIGGQSRITDEKKALLQSETVPRKPQK